MVNLADTLCPRCRQDAPIVYRGLAAYCTACGAPRLPLTASSVNLAGRPSQIGGVLGRALGWFVLAVGGLLGLTLLAVLQYAFPGGFVGYAVGGGIAVITLASAVMLWRGGRSLERGGAAAEKRAKIAAIFAMASLRGGVVRANEVASALGIGHERADALLTELAKSQPDCVALELDASGQVYYVVNGEGARRLRVELPSSEPGAEPAAAPSEVQPPRASRR